MKVSKEVFERQPATPEAAVVQPSAPPVPTCVNEPVSGPEAVRVEVAVPYTPAAPFEVRSWEEDGWDVVPRPVYVTLPPEPMMLVFAGTTNGPEMVSDEVATPNALPAPVDEYTSTFPAETGDEVASPVPPEADPASVIGEAPMTVKEVQLTVPEQVTEVVAT